MLVALLPLLASPLAPQDCTPDAHVWILAGQSNMFGFLAFEEELPPELAAPQADVAFWDGAESAPTWRPLAPGSGLDFGPELSLGRALADAAPEDQVYLVKHAVNGTALYDDWAPAGGPQWLGLEATVSAALADLAQAGVSAELAGFVWMQGESDAAEGQGAAYEANLRAFVDELRLELQVPDLPFVLGRILTGWGDAANNTAVREAQVEVATTTPAVAWVDTDGISAFGGHYDAAGQVQLGQAFAAAWYGLLDQGTWTDLGQGLAGTSGVAPQLVGEGLLWPCAPTEVTLTGAPPFAAGMLAVGTAAAPQPFLGGTLVPDLTPPGGLSAFVTDAAGTATFAQAWHPASPPGFALTLQAWVEDPATGQWAASNGLEAQAP